MTLDELLTYKSETPAPLTYCLCGSTDKAKDAFRDENKRLTLEGYIVLSIGVNARDSELDITHEQKRALDILHLYKIDKADRVRILNVGGYIGESTRRELAYALLRLHQGKLQAIEYLETPREDITSW